MKFLLSVAAVLLSLSTVRASDFVAVYALVDKVVMEPNSDQPDRIQIWGVFALAKADNGSLYEAPQRGYLYFTLPPNQQDLAKKEWADFKSIAGKRQVVGFGNRHMMKVRARKSDEKPAAPDVYLVEMGLFKLRSDTDYAPIKSLLDAASH